MVKTKAAVVYEPNKPIRVEEVDLGPVLAEDVLIRIAASGICHTDLHVIQGLFPQTYPLVMGHEGAGVVEEVGSAALGVKKGDHVIINLFPFCGRCQDCVTGFPYRCAVKRGLGGKLYDGTTRYSRNGRPIHHFAGGIATHAYHTIVHHSCAIPIPKEVPLDRACVAGCAVPTGVGAVINTARVRPGSTVVVIGCGGIGLNAIQGARLAGAGRVIAVDVLEHKLALAREFGATETIDASMENTVKAVGERTRGRGADYAIEAIGKVETIQEAYNCLGQGGKAVIIGMVPPGSQISIDPGTLLRERTLTGSTWGSTQASRDLPMYMDLYLAGRLKIDELITRYARLEDINEGLEDLHKGKVIRTVMRME